MRLSGTKTNSIHQYRGLGDQLWDISGTRPSLDLRFADSKSLVDATTGQNLVTFTRASSGTYVGSDGVLKTATTNLLLRSEEFDNASWAAGAGGNASVTPNAIQSPVGTLTADLLDDTSAVAVLGKSQSIVITSSTRSYTASCYIKANSSSVASVRLSVGTGGTTVAGEVVVNLSTGAAQWRAGTVGTSFSVVSAGDNWYKVAVVVTDNASGNTLCIAEFRPAFATTYSDTLNSAAQGSAYFWGAQLEQSSTVGEYIPTTSTINSAPRFDHNPTTGESLGLLVEEQRTNSIRNNTMVGAVAGTPGTNPNLWLYASTQSNGLTVSIVGTGVENGINYIDYRFNGTTVASPAGCAIGFDNASAATGQTWTESLYWKLAAGTTTGVNNWQLGIIENTAGGAFVTGAFYTQTAPTANALITQRPVATRTLSGGATVGLVSATLNIPVVGNTAIDFTLRIGLPQLEQGAFATSVIPTTGTAATRSADVASITGTNFSSWYRQDEGTLFADATIANTGSNRFIVGASDATVNEEVALYWNTVFNSLVTDGAASQANSFGGTVTAGSRALHSFAYKANDFQGYGNAVALSADTSGTLPTADRLTIGSRVNSTFWTNGTIRRLTYWPARLANSTLQDITR